MKTAILSMIILGPLLQRAANAVTQPLQQRDQWQIEDPAAWEWQGAGDATTLVLKKPSKYKPKVRRPVNLAWFDGAEWGSFTLTCEARLDVFNKGNNDVCIDLKGMRAIVEATGFTGYHEIEIFSNRWWSADQDEFLAHIQEAYTEHC